MQVLAAMENLPALPEGEPRPGTVGEEQMEVDQIGRDQGDRTAKKISKGIVTGNVKQFQISSKSCK